MNNEDKKIYWIEPGKAPVLVGINCIEDKWLLRIGQSVPKDDRRVSVIFKENKD